MCSPGATCFRALSWSIPDSKRNSRVAANIAAFEYYLHRGEFVVAVGASGAVFAVVGALVFIILRNKGRVRGLSLQQMLIMLFFSLYFGFVSTDVSNVAHIVGLIAGFLSGALLYRKQ